MEVLPYLTGAGTYYLDIGGKVSRWTNADERAAFCFDNITLSLSKLQATTKLLTGSGGLGSNVISEDLDGDMMPDLALSSPQDGRVRVFRGNEPHWGSLPGINQGMANFTIEGGSDQAFGGSMVVMGTSPFTLNKGLIVSDHLAPSPSVTGIVHLFDLPLTDATLTIADAADTVLAYNETHDLGFKVITVGDIDENSYPEVLLFHYDAADRLCFKLFDRSPTAPFVDILSPGYQEDVSGTIEIRVQVDDVDGDADAWDARFYRSIDYIAWTPLGNGTPDRVEGDIAIKEWNTTPDENRRYFLRVTVTDDFGMSTTSDSGGVDVINHRSPVVSLVYPMDGAVLKNIEAITGRVTLATGEVLRPPVRFLISRDNGTWEEFANRSTVLEGGYKDFEVQLDTRALEDGPVWFRINATTVYGLGGEARNMGPCRIDNAYPPDVAFLPLPEGELNGTVDIQVFATDLDEDITTPVELFIKKPDVSYYDTLANMTGPVGNGTYHYLWDTTGVDNGAYDMKVRVHDSTYNQVEVVFNRTLTVHNLYNPIIEIQDIDEGDVVSGKVVLRAIVVDKDMNIGERDARFLFRRSGITLWSPISPTLLRSGTASVEWDTRKLPNGEYSLKVEVKDRDNLTAEDSVGEIFIRNPNKPLLWPDMPSNLRPLSGVVRLAFNVSDDEALDPSLMRVEVSSDAEHWTALSGLERSDPGGSFGAWKNISYFVEWDTEQKVDGHHLFPDSPWYEIRVSVTDSMNLTTEWRSPAAYEVRNGEGGDDDTNIGGGGLPLWVYAVLFLVAVVVFVVVLFVFFLKGEKKKEEPPMYPRAVTPPPEPRPTQPVMRPEVREGGIYAPSTYQAAPAPEPAPVSRAEPLMFGAEAEVPPPSISEEEETTTREMDMFERMFEGKKGPPPAPKRKEAVKKIITRHEVKVELPEGVMPKGLKKEKAPPPKEEPEDWGGEEYEAEEEESWEELEEEPEEEEEDEELMVVECKCGTEIELPPGFKRGKFMCPNCGRTGRLK